MKHDNPTDAGLCHECTYEPFAPTDGCEYCVVMRDFMQEKNEKEKSDE